MYLYGAPGPATAVSACPSTSFARCPQPARWPSHSISGIVRAWLGLKQITKQLPFTLSTPGTISFLAASSFSLLLRIVVGRSNCTGGEVVGEHIGGGVSWVGPVDGTGVAWAQVALGIIPEAGCSSSSSWAPCQGLFRSVGRAEDIGVRKRIVSAMRVVGETGRTFLALEETFLATVLNWRWDELREADGSVPLGRVWRTCVGVRRLNMRKELGWFYMYRQCNLEVRHAPVFYP